MPVPRMPSEEELRRSLEEVKKQITGLEAKLKKLDVAADSLKKARKLIRTRTPSGSEVLSEMEIADGKPKTITARGETLEEAFSKGRTKVPTGAQIIRETALQKPRLRIITVKAFEEKEARQKAGRKTKKNEHVQQCRMIKPERSRFLGLGRKPALYEISFQRIAIVEIVAKGKASVRATVGGKHVMEDIIQLRSKASALESGLAQLRSGAPESRASSSPIRSNW